MAILKIARMGNPVLNRRATEVGDPTAPEIAALVADMIETMHDARGRGLAAPQVHVGKRVMVFRPPATDAELDNDEEPAVLALVNPEIEVLSDETEDGWEACLSVPGMRGMVRRYTRVRYRGVTPEGEAIEREVDGFHARVFQHEFDHLDGVLYPMRMTDLSLLVFDSEIDKLVAELDTDEDEIDAAAAAAEG